MWGSGDPDFIPHRPLDHRCQSLDQRGGVVPMWKNNQCGRLGKVKDDLFDDLCHPTQQITERND
jgi:hypothetical protein